VPCRTSPQARQTTSSRPCHSRWRRRPAMS